MCLLYQPSPLYSFPQIQTRCDVDESITDEVLKGIAFREGSAEFSFFFLTELSLKVNKFVLIPDAPVLLYKTLDKRS